MPGSNFHTDGPALQERNRDCDEVRKPEDQGRRVSPHSSLLSISPPTRVSKKLLRCRPATMQLGHISDFVNECSTGSLPCDFVSSHLYPSDPQCGQTKESWDPSCFSRLIKGARAKVPASMEFFVTEMSVT